ncbi:TetR/AcrR family transcriptional regulator [Bradyrhizobium jicamae]|uniref:TetR/AcrR family transcriptional regulator n=1 Tax=Bradyrhizobium jicamae TaxID=280332 RepID=UPI001BAB787C|nr:TetR/AcrR family transcriptional regulator [Bradyrhizobium jicamae]MBR0939032.1 TetR/AcrR family transcriptional regulator [Bradyrhizobium jicamae]
MASADCTSVHLVADEENSKRRQILDGACKVFMDLGFDAASMSEIARAAGVSKGTLYVYFTDKCRLFDAILDEKALEKRQLAFYFDPACDIKTMLQKFGETHVRTLCRPGGASAARMVLAIAERMPEVGRRYYEYLLQKTVNGLAEYLDARVKQRELAINDCELAAAQFILMCQATLFLPFIFEVTPAPSQDRIARVVGEAVQTFLAAHAVKAI